MTKITLYKKCNELFRSIDMQEIIDSVYLRTVKSNLPNILVASDDSHSIPQLILSNVFKQLSEELRPAKMNHKELQEVYDLFDMNGSK